MPIYKNKKLWLVVAGVAILILVSLAVYYSARRSDTPITSVTPKPSISSVPSSKTAITSSTTPTPELPAKSTPTPTPQPINGIVVSIDSITLRDGGIIKVASTVAGATTGTCTLQLIDPNQKLTNFSGTIETNGPAFFCSLETISGVNDSGNWSAKLTASANGKTGSSSKDFTK